MKILAIDPAAKCGFAYGDDALLTAGTWDLSTRRDESAGMKLLRLESKLVEAQKTGIDLLVYETPALHTYALALMSHSKFIGVIERFCVKHNINYRGYAPTELKKFATGKGNAGKSAVREAVRKRWGHDSADDNEADAIALFYMAIADYTTVTVKKTPAPAIALFGAVVHEPDEENPF